VTGCHGCGNSGAEARSLSWRDGHSGQLYADIFFQKKYPNFISPTSIKTHLLQNSSNTYFILRLKCQIKA
jgi:hypothetical protein